VIKVELPGRGDDTRVWGPPFMPDPGDPVFGKQSTYFLSVNRNKRSIAIDIANPKGAALVRRLVGEAHVMIENFKVDGLLKYGLDQAAVRAAHPKLVYCSITGYGQNGPYADRAGYDFVAQAMGGLMSVTGELGGGPLKTGVAICDLFTGLYATTAILAALRHAERTGEGQHIDCALLDTQVAMLANQAMAYLGAGVVGKPLGNAHPSIVPYRTFEAADGPLVVAVGNDGQFATLCRIVGRPDLATDPRYAASPARVVHRAELEEQLQQAMATKTSAALVDALSAAGVPAGPINTVDKVFADAQIAARETVRWLERPDGARVPTVAFPPKLSETPARYDLPPPRLAEHSRDVLTDWLGLAAGEIDALMSDGVVA
jgi:crotonobetainyl-CoA:carnitine CoA-transferase CaiB-like acyl-CoA transferase